MNQPTASITIRVLAGSLAGVVGGVVFGLLSSPPLGFGLNLVISAALGLVFGLVVGPKVGTTGAGLVWGEAYGLFWWLIGWLTLIPVLSGQGLVWTITEVRETFPLLLGLVVGYGAVLGLTYCLLAQGFSRLKLAPPSRPTDQPMRRIPTPQAIVPRVVQAGIMGGFGGLSGCWVFMRGIEPVEFFP